VDSVGKRKTEVNTLALIRKWSMDGARDDLGDRFGSFVDINAIVAERDEDATEEVPPPAPAPVLLKRAGEDDGWLPLLAAESA
jgi:hypothetical protein